MTLPEHVICSLMIAELGVRQRLGLRGVLVVVAAGIAPDLDTAAKLFGDQYFWNLHHALGHSVLSVIVIAAVSSAAGSVALKLRNFGLLFRWSLLAAVAHCITDSLYWWGIQPFWPVDSYELCFSLIEYLDLFVLAIWLGGAACLFRSSKKDTANCQRVAALALCTFTGYVALRAILPKPTGLFHLLTGGWMYAAPQGTPVLDWW
tara:strand:- start:48107 stop:48721 length:615 start_codon:yes stop_codon:yes gene_type:complete